MKKFAYLLILAMGVTACSVESVDSTENLLTADMKVKIQQSQKSMNLKAVEICEGEAPVFVFNFPQDLLGNGNVKDTEIQIQLWNTMTGQWEQIEKLSYSGAGPEDYTYTKKVFEIGTYNFRASIGSGGFDYYTTLDVFDCSNCEESFTYITNEDGSYTFTFIPEEDMVDAELVFTFAQGVVVEGLENWNSNGVTKQTTMSLEACETYSWTVNLDADCKGKGQEDANLWTDFKVNDVSKKVGLENITKSCN